MSLKHLRLQKLRENRINRHNLNMLSANLLCFLALFVLSSGVDTKLEDIDILFLSKLKANLRNVPKSVHCGFIRKAVAEIVYDGRTDYRDNKDVLIQVCDMLEAKKANARSSFISLLNECIVAREGNQNVPISENSSPEPKVFSNDDGSMQQGNIDQERSAIPSGSSDLLEPTRALSEASLINCGRDALKVEEKYAKLLMEHDISVREYKQLYAEFIGVKVKMDQLDSENKSLKSQKKGGFNVESYTSLIDKVEKMREELRNSFEESRVKKEPNHDRLEHELNLAKAKNEQCEKNIMRLNEALDIHKQSLQSCFTSQAKLVVESKEIQSKCDQKVIELVERYEMKAQENEKNVREVNVLETKIFSIKNELAKAQGNAKYCASRLDEFITLKRN